MRNNYPGNLQNIKTVIIVGTPSSCSKDSNPNTLHNDWSIMDFPKESFILDEKRPLIVNYHHLLFLSFQNHPCTVSESETFWNWLLFPVNYTWIKNDFFCSFKVSDTVPENECVWNLYHIIRFSYIKSNKTKKLIPPSYVCKINRCGGWWLREKQDPWLSVLAYKTSELFLPQ